MNNHWEIADRIPPQLCGSATNRTHRASCTPRYLSQTVLLVLTIAVLSSVPGCGPLRLNPDPEVVPSRMADRVWTPPPSLQSADDGVSKVDQLRRLDEIAVRQLPVNGAYDLPTLVDLALKTNPQTRGAWYAALKANAQLPGNQKLLTIPLFRPMLTVLILNCRLNSRDKLSLFGMKPSCLKSRSAMTYSTSDAPALLNAAPAKS